MLKAMQECGVQLHVGYILAQWNNGEDCTEIKSASFTSSDEPLTLDCGVSTYFYLIFHYGLTSKLILT